MRRIVRAFVPPDDLPEDRLHDFCQKLLSLRGFFREPKFVLPPFITSSHPFLRKLHGDVRKFREKVSRPAVKLVFPQAKELLLLLESLEQALSHLPPVTRRPRTSEGRNLTALESQARALLELYTSLAIPLHLPQTGPAWSNDPDTPEGDLPLFQQICHILAPHLGESVIRRALS